MLKVGDGRAIKRVVGDTLKRDLDNIRVVAAGGRGREADRLIIASPLLA